MIFNNFKKAILIHVSLMTLSAANEIPQNHQAPINLPFHKIEQDYEQYLKDPHNETRINIIANLNNLLLDGQLSDSKLKEKAIEIAKNIKAQNLLVRLTKSMGSNIGSLQELPDELVSYLIDLVTNGYTDLNEIHNLLQVNKTFHSLLMKAPLKIDLAKIAQKDLSYVKMLHGMSNSSSFNIENIIYVLIELFQNIESLILPPLSNNAEEERIFRHIKRLRNLRRLEVYEYSSNQLKYIGSLTNLKSLYFHGLTVSSDDLAHLGPLENLNELIIEDLKVDETALNYIARIGLKNLKTLKKLTLSGRSYSYGNSIFMISEPSEQHDILIKHFIISAPNLQSLTLEHFYGITNEWLSSLSTLSSLKELTLSGLNIGIDDLQVLNQLPNLEVLNLIDMKLGSWDQDPWDEDRVHSLLPNLQSLQLNIINSMENSFNNVTMDNVNVPTLPTNFGIGNGNNVMPQFLPPLPLPQNLSYSNLPVGSAIHPMPQNEKDDEDSMQIDSDSNQFSSFSGLSDSSYLRNNAQIQSPSDNDNDANMNNVPRWSTNFGIGNGFQFGNNNFTGQIPLPLPSLGTNFGGDDSFQIQNFPISPYLSNQPNTDDQSTENRKRTYSDAKSSDKQNSEEKEKNQESQEGPKFKKGKFDDS